MEKLLTVKALAIILSRSEGAIRNDLSRNPERLPCPLAMPGGRLLRWRLSAVVEWLDSLGNFEKQEEKVLVVPQKRRRGRPTKAAQIRRNKVL